MAISERRREMKRRRQRREKRLKDRLRLAKAAASNPVSAGRESGAARSREKEKKAEK